MVTGPKGNSEEVEFGPVTEKNIAQLRALNTALFPVKYNENFYRDAINAREGFVQLGAVMVRKEPTATGSSRIYIMTLGVLAPYRERGIGGQLLEHVFKICASHPACADVTDISLHVHTANSEAIEFYGKRGFEIVERIPKYYKRGVEPPDCYLLRKILRPQQLSQKKTLLTEIP